MTERRAHKAIEDLRRVTANRRQARSTLLEKASYEPDRMYHSRLLAVDDDIIAVIDRHLTEARARGEESSR